jgi:glycosyltransferase 2 family protein
VKSGIRRLRWLLWLPVPLLLYWALRGVRAEELGQILGRLSGGRLALLLAVNLCFFAVLAGRWAWILHGLGERLTAASVLRLAASRLAGFSVSYLTPGPQFGGEPVQLALARRWTGLAYERGSASLLLDKSFELAGNFAFLGVGVVAVRAVPEIAGRLGGSVVLLLPALLALIPVAYLAAVFTGRRPLSALAARLPSQWRARPWHARLTGFLQASEEEVAAYGRRPLRALAQALLSFVAAWTLSVLEQWLVLRFLGMPCTIPQTLVLQAGVKLAMLLPLPGALGALEAAQRTVLDWMGHAPEGALALSIYVRARDLAFTLAGLLALAVGGSRRAAPRKRG